MDDSMVVRHTICRFLEDRGFAAEPATNARQAIQMAADLRPSVIITELNLREMSGEELIAELKASPETAEIPVVALTARRATAAHSRVEFIVHKDIDLVQQLDRVIAALE